MHKNIKILYVGDNMSEQHNHNHEHNHLDEHTSKEELVVLMKYMVAHNESHAKQLDEIAQKLNSAHEHEAYNCLVEALSCAEKMNEKINEA